MNKYSKSRASEVELLKRCSKNVVCFHASICNSSGNNNDNNNNNNKEY